MNPNHRLPLTVMVRHSEPLLAVGIVTALRQHADFHVLAHGVDAVDGETVDVVIADYETGLGLVADLQRHDARRSLAACKVMVLTADAREGAVRAAMAQGVRGYLLMGCALDELALAVRMLQGGSRYLSPAVASAMVESMTHEALTVREAEVLRLLAQGCCNKTIACELAITVGTVKTHVKGIMGKFHASSRTEAASIAVRRGLVDDAPPIGSLAAMSRSVAMAAGFGPLARGRQFA